MFTEHYVHRTLCSHNRITILQFDTDIFTYNINYTYIYIRKNHEWKTAKD